MAFFDDLGKKLSQAGQATVAKTKELADIARINSFISDEEKKINNFYLEIGKLYASLNAETCAPEYADMIKGIKEAEEKIKEYNAELIEIKGVKTCPNCGAEVKNDAMFCSGCGEKMPQPEVVVESAETVAETATEATTEEVTEATAEEVVEDAKKCCSNCGAEVKPEAAFCAECGTKL